MLQVEFVVSAVHFLIANHLEIHLVVSSLRKGRQQELQARLMEADRNRDELQRVREELQMYLQYQVEKGDLDQTCCSRTRKGVPMCSMTWHTINFGTCKWWRKIHRKWGQQESHSLPHTHIYIYIICAYANSLENYHVETTRAYKRAYKRKTDALPRWRVWKQSHFWGAPHQPAQAEAAATDWGSRVSTATGCIENSCQGAAWGQGGFEFVTAVEWLDIFGVLMRLECVQECDQKYRNWESQRQEVEQQLGRCCETWEVAKGAWICLVVFASLRLFETDTVTDAVCL